MKPGWLMTSQTRPTFQASVYSSFGSYTALSVNHSKVDGLDVRGDSSIHKTPPIYITPLINHRTKPDVVSHIFNDFGFHLSFAVLEVGIEFFRYSCSREDRPKMALFKKNIYHFTFVDMNSMFII